MAQQRQIETQCGQSAVPLLNFLKEKLPNLKIGLWSVRANRQIEELLQENGVLAKLDLLKRCIEKNPDLIINAVEDGLFPVPYLKNGVSLDIDSWFVI